MKPNDFNKLLYLDGKGEEHRTPAESQWLNEQCTEPSLDIQWPDTDPCLHLTCVCGAETHRDSPYIETIMCKGCGRIFSLPRSVTPIEIAGPTR